MAILKERTKKGLFYLEIGSFSDKKNKSEENLEDYFSRTTSGSQKVNDAYNIFINYHLSNGYKKRELRLDRTVIEFGRRKS